MRPDECRICKRRKVPLIIYVSGSGYWRLRGELKPVPGGRVPLSIRARSSATCLDRADCHDVIEARRRKRTRRNELPADAVLAPLHEVTGGCCKWCGQPIYRINKDGRVVPNRLRLWHDGRATVVGPDGYRGTTFAEPRCVYEYHAQAFTFRDQVEARDHGVCADCGRDIAAETEQWRAERPEQERDDDYKMIGDWAEWDHAMADWRSREPTWQADHIVPLEDGGEHLLANAQTLCSTCHGRKTGRENSERAARRRGDEPDRQERLAM